MSFLAFSDLSQATVLETESSVATLEATADQPIFDGAIAPASDYSHSHISPKLQEQALPDVDAFATPVKSSVVLEATDHSPEIQVNSALSSPTDSAMSERDTRLFETASAAFDRS
jgi:hypothetical protein